MNRLIKDNFYFFCLFFFSFAINFYSANKGVLPIDTFLHYDSSSNILKGNIPIRDFWIVHGLTLDYMQAFFLMFLELIGLVILYILLFLMQ